MEILKKKIEDLTLTTTYGDKFLRHNRLTEALKEFEERRKKSNQFADSFMNQQREEIKRLEKENAHLKICVEKNIGDAWLWEKKYNDSQKELSKSIKLATFWEGNCTDWACKWEFYINNLKKNPWVSIDHPPVDDASVLVIHSSFPDVVHMAFYDEESKEYLSIDSPRTMAINCTHYMYLPKLPDIS
jgi:hypothetical protein